MDHHTRPSKIPVARPPTRCIFTPKRNWRRIQNAIDATKQSQPKQLDDLAVDFSPRSNDGQSDALGPSDSSEPGKKQLSFPASVSIQIEDEEGAAVEINETGLSTVAEADDDPSFLSASGPSGRPQTDRREEDVKSRISFVMRERMHSLVREVQRRTSTVRDGLLRETPDDATSIISTIAPMDEHRPSLMSLIGLQKAAEAAEQNRKPWYLRSINPYGSFYMAWLSLVSLAFLYNAFGVPLRSSYPYQTKDNIVYWLIVDYLCDLIYLIDMLAIKTKLTFIHGGITIRDNKAMLKNYLRSRTITIDALCLIPTDLLYLKSGPLPIWRMNRVLKIQSFWLLFDMLDNSVSNPYAIRIARTLSYMIYIIHCNSCIYYLLSAWQAFGQIAYLENGKYYLNKWVYNNQGNAYIRCFYFTAAVATSTGNNPAPTNVIEYIYMTFSWMMGVFVFALLLGQIRDIVSNANRNREEYQRKMDMALGECMRLGLPKDLIDRVRNWFIYTWEQQKTLDEKKLIEKLPLKLQTDLALSVHYNTLSKVKLFQDCDRALLRDLVLKLRPVIFLPGDLICRKGDVGKEMYIVNQGVLQVVGGDNNETVFAEMVEGSVVGEISLLGVGGNNRRTASIRAKGYVTLFVLAKDDLNDVIKYYPQAQVILKRKAAAMLKNDDKNAQTAEKEDRKLEDTCKIGGLSTPRMVQVVADILDPGKRTAKDLQEALHRGKEAEKRRQSLYPWSVDNHDESDDSAFEGMDYESGEDEPDNSEEEAQRKKNQ